MSTSNKKSEDFNNIEALIDYSKRLALMPPDAPEWEDLVYLSDHLTKVLEVRNEELEALMQHRAAVAAQRLSLDNELEKLWKMPDRVLQFWDITDCRQWRAEEVPEDDLEEVKATATILIEILIDYEKAEKLKPSNLQQRQLLRLTRDQLENQFMICMEHMNKVFRAAVDKDKGLAENEKGEPGAGEKKRMSEEDAEETDISEVLQLEDALVEIAETFPAGEASKSIQILNEDDGTEEVLFIEGRADESSEAVSVEEELGEDMDGWLIAVHTLRGGIGSTSIAVNLAIGLQKLWRYPTLLIDNDLVSGQVALMLNTSAGRTWADICATDDGEPGIDALQEIISAHDSGLYFLAAPVNSAEREIVDHITVQSAFQTLRKKYDYLVADLAHDFNNATLEVLKAADRVLLVLSPEIVSVRLAAVALHEYNEHHIHSNKVQLVLVHNLAQSQLKENEIEKALNHSISHIIPYAPKSTNRAIASGVPFLIRDPKNPLSSAVENLAYFTSKPIHQEIPPPKPSNTWKRVDSRLGLSNDDNQKGKLALPFLENLQGVSKVAQNFESQIMRGSPFRSKNG